MTEADDIRRVADQIAAQLGERATPPVLQIRRIVKVLGVERAQAFAREALAVEARGGLLVPDGSRRRTLGTGVPYGTSGSSQFSNCKLGMRAKCWVLFVTRVSW